MFDEKEKKDLELLIEMGNRQGGKLSSMIVSNYFVGFSSGKQTEDIYNAFRFPHFTLTGEIRITG